MDFCAGAWVFYLITGYGLQTLSPWPSILISSLYYLKKKVTFFFFFKFFHLCGLFWLAGVCRTLDVFWCHHQIILRLKQTHNCFKVNLLCIIVKRNKTSLGPLCLPRLPINLSQLWEVSSKFCELLDLLVCAWCSCRDHHSITWLYYEQIFELLL